MAVDRLAVLPAAPLDVRLRLVRRPPRESEYATGPGSRLAWAGLRDDGFWAPVRRTGSRQSARLEQRRAGRWPPIVWRLGHSGFRSSGTIDAASVSEPRAPAARQPPAAVAATRRLPVHHPFDRLHHPELCAVR